MRTTGDRPPGTDQGAATASHFELLPTGAVPRTFSFKPSASSVAIAFHYPHDAAQVSVQAVPSEPLGWYAPPGPIMRAQAARGINYPHLDASGNPSTHPNPGRAQLLFVPG